MKLVEQLCAVAQAFMQARRLSVGRTSSLVFGDGTKLGALMTGGADLTTARFEHAMDWFLEHWPDGVPLPKELWVSPNDAWHPGTEEPAAAALVREMFERHRISCVERDVLLSGFRRDAEAAA